MNVKLGNLKSSVFSLLSVVCLLSSVICLLSSTTVERALQIHPFLTNKANFRKSQVNVTNLLTMNYGKMDTWSNEKNKANSKPKQTQYKPKTKPIYPVVASGEAGSKPIPEKAKINVTYCLTKNYEQISMNNELIKTNPIQTQTNPIGSELECPACPEQRSRKECSQRDRTCFRSKKILPSKFML
jgi:hypothetical protein